MGIYDREYINPRSGGASRGDHRAPIGVGPPLRSPFSKLRVMSTNTWLIIINIAVFVIGAFMPDVINTATGVVGNRLFHYGHFSTFEGFQRLEIWRLVTFQFLHANLMHLFFNMFGLWIFGSLVEEHLGSRRYLAYYLVCGIFGGLTYLLLNLLGSVAGLSFPGVLINDPKTPLVGASAGVFAVIMACAFIAPKMRVQLIFPPIPLSMKVMAYGYVGIAALNLLMGGGNAGGDAAHVGGAVAGFFFIRNVHLLRDFFDVFNDSRKNAQGRRVTAREDELNRILDKIKRVGIGELTAKEKRILAEASRTKRD